MDYLIGAIIALVAATIGAIAGGFANSFWNYKYTRIIAQDAKRESINNLIRALLTELTILNKKYMIIAGNRIEQAKNDEIPLIGILESGHNYFSIFDNNSNPIGLLDKDICHKIIETYLNAKALLDEIRYYGILSDKHQEAEKQMTARKELIEFIKPKPELQPIIFPLELSINAKLSHEKVIEYFSYLKERHFEVKELFIDTISALQKKIKFPLKLSEKTRSQPPFGNQIKMLSLIA